MSPFLLLATSASIHYCEQNVTVHGTQTAILPIVEQHDV